MLGGRRGARACRAKEHPLPLIIGAEFLCVCGLKLVILATTRQGYGH